MQVIDISVFSHQVKNFNDHDKKDQKIRQTNLVATGQLLSCFHRI